jgi:hypothetical protein
MGSVTAFFDYLDHCQFIEKDCETKTPCPIFHKYTLFEDEFGFLAEIFRFDGRPEYSLF